MNVIEDKWLSNKFGFNVYKLINFNFYNKTLYKRKKIFIYAKLEINKKNYNKENIYKNFQFVDLNVSFKKKIKSKKIFLKNCRFANQCDKNKILNLSKNAFQYSRFKLDKNIPKIISNKIQSDWINSYFKGKRGDYLIVSEYKKNIRGFLLLFAKNKKFTIDLIATSKKFQRKGIATSMIHFAIHNIFNGEAEVNVGTQMSNIKSIRFYKKLGLKIISIKAIYHFLKY